jgi:O-antigen/teichoic acid export membrane protein
MRIVFEGKHFKRFIKIFSFTSLSSIIGGLSGSMDTIFLARFISPAMITIFEINKRPVQLTQSLIGRHSVALMPTISHAIGANNKSGILKLISTQFKYYSYAAIIIALVFCFNYQDLILGWTGKGKYAGDTIIYLLVANFFFMLIGYFMSNMGYALGDIKINSLINILKGIFIGILYYWAAKYYGIPGVLSIMLAGYVLIDFSIFSYRLYKLGFLRSSLIRNTLRLWILIIPALAILGLGCSYLVNTIILPDLHILKLVLNGGLFTLLALFILFSIDAVLRSDIIQQLKFIPFPAFLKKQVAIKK